VQPQQFGHIPWLDVEKVNASTDNSTAMAASAARPEQNGARARVYVQASTRDRLNIYAQNTCTHTSRECTGALSYSRCCLFCLVAILKVESKGLELELLSSSNPFSCFPAPSQGQRHGARGGGGLQPDVAARPLIGPEFCSVFTRGECLLSPLDLLSCPSIMLQCLLSAYINAVHPATLFKFIPAGM